MRTSTIRVRDSGGLLPPASLFPLLLLLSLGGSVLIFPAHGGATPSDTEPAAEGEDGLVIVFTQLPRNSEMEREDPPLGGTLGTSHGEGARIVMLGPGSRRRVLTNGFHSASDPEVSFDGRRMLFAGKKRATDSWNIFETMLDGSGIRQVTRDSGNCRSPVYLGTIYTITDEAPSDQIAFVSDLAGELNEFGPVPSTSLFSCRPDGSEVRRLTYNPSSDLDPAVLPDGRLVFSSWQRATLKRGFPGRLSLFAAQTDGLDYAIFSGDEGRRVKKAPCVTTDRLVVFVEGERIGWDGAGSLAAVSLRRNLHSYRRITRDSDGLFLSPSPLPEGGILVSRRPADGTGTHGIYRMDPSSGRLQPIFDDPDRHDIQAKVVAARSEPDGRSSVVSEEFSTGRFYCLNVYESDLRGRGWIAAGTPTRLRVLEGIPRKTGASDLSPESRARAALGGYHTVGAAPLLQRRILGEMQVEKDGSFNVEVPANIPIELQLLDADGVALRSCSWIWVRKRETRGCIGCHEDGEMTPRNRLVEAVAQPSVPLTLPPEKRRTVGYRRDIRPILDARCATGGCHVAGRVAPLLAGEGQLGAGARGGFDPAYRNLLSGSWIEGASGSPVGSFVHPGRARTSPLIWHVLGKNTSRPWDGTGGGESVPAPMPVELTEEEKRTLVEWIDLGAPWDGVE